MAMISTSAGGEVLGEEDATESTNRHLPVITGTFAGLSLPTGLRDDAGDEGNIDGDRRALARKRPEPGRAACPFSTSRLSVVRAAGTDRVQPSRSTISLMVNPRPGSSTGGSPRQRVKRTFGAGLTEIHFTPVGRSTPA
jgi:hypothetical protein